MADFGQYEDFGGYMSGDIISDGEPEPVAGKKALTPETSGSSDEDGLDPPSPDMSDLFAAKIKRTKHIPKKTSTPSSVRQNVVASTPRQASKPSQLQRKYGQCFT